MNRRVDLSAHVLAPKGASAADQRRLGGLSGIHGRGRRCDQRVSLRFHGNTWTNLHEHLQSEGISLDDFPPVVLKNRWHQFPIEDRNTEFTGYPLAGLIFGHREVIDVLDQRDGRGSRGRR
jgi:hypothetical protein